MLLKTTSLFQSLLLIKPFRALQKYSSSFEDSNERKVKEKSLSQETKGHPKQLSYSKSRFRDFKPGSLSFVMTAGKVYSFFQSETNNLSKTRKRESNRFQRKPGLKSWTKKVTTASSSFPGTSYFTWRCLLSFPSNRE